MADRRQARIWEFVLLFVFLFVGFDVVAEENGMSVSPFYGQPTILEVQCSGSGLEANSKLVSLALYGSSKSSIVASVNLVNKECSTSDTFSSCEIHSNDDRRTAVKSLVFDLREGEERQYGCEVNSLRPRGGRRSPTGRCW
ncbi:uncharacterized protein LOC112568951 [Pomacea canaliculata]|uniref:uncharacterized protein LOC112568951 n=1 Tax=Pomacea canaliculata TaxID=400727 RepID=UPI000D731333|nr:uncharacterized protein LOC112568951 [Pomacea canaliculata]